jgi:hypothetical protein
MAAALKTKKAEKVESRMVAAPPAQRSDLPVLIHNEREEDYHKLRDDIVRAVQPHDFLEELWVGDVINLTWELIRLRRAKNALVEARMQDGMFAVLDRLSVTEPWRVALDWRRRDPITLEEIDEWLKKCWADDGCRGGGDTRRQFG